MNLPMNKVAVFVNKRDEKEGLSCFIINKMLYLSERISERERKMNGMMDYG